MNFNDINDLDPAFVLHTEEDELLQNDILKSSDSNSLMQIKSKANSNFLSKGLIIRGKENDCSNTGQNYTKNIITNHSFNGFFNQNAQKTKNSIKESINKRQQLGDISYKNFQVNSPTNFNSTGKLSNLQFVVDSSKNSDSQQLMHSEVKSFVKKYFPENFEAGNFHAKYFTIENFVEILFEEFQDLIGGQNGYSLIKEFGQKIFIAFGDKIYFEDLFEKTLENGLTGLIFQIVKSINEDRRENIESKENRVLLKPIQTIPPKNSFQNKSILSSGLGTLKSQKKNQFIGFNYDSIGNSGVSRVPSQKISLDRFFGVSTSNVKFQDQLSNQEENSLNEQNIEEVKRILEDYIESMYEQAESKLNKKYTQEMKKITVKYKETQKLLEKVNEKISNHYDSIQLEKEHEKKIKLHLQKQLEMQNKIKKLEYELKVAKDDAEKEKLNSFKLEQESIKLKEKLEKYENAIFEKAMQKGSNQSSINGSSIMKEAKTSSSIYSQNQSTYQQPSPQQNPPKFEVRIDTITEHRPIQIPVINTQHQSPYSAYASRHALGSNGGLTPTRIRELERTPSVSPIKQRISFVKTQNPSANSRIVINQNDPKSSSNIDNLKVSNVEMGEKIQLRPLSPIGKLTELGSTQKQNYGGVTQTSVTGQTQNLYAQKTHSPIKVQFCTSRVSTMPVQNR